MRVHVLQHVPFEGLGSIRTWLNRRNAVVSHTRFFEDSTVPDPGTVDLVVALGGPMSVNDEAGLPWIVDEKRFIAAAIRAGKPVLGICLGAQLIASALGAKVYPGPHKEIGWFDVRATSHGPDTFAFPTEARVFHWHGETFDLPPEATRLASSAAYENQAFQFGTRVLGLQFHLETTPESLDAIIANNRQELADGAFIQSERDMRRVPNARYAAINELMDAVLTFATRPMA